MPEQHLDLLLTQSVRERRIDGGRVGAEREQRAQQRDGELDVAGQSLLALRGLQVMAVLLLYQRECVSWIAR